jgi:hypothetical protein
LRLSIKGQRRKTMIDDRNRLAVAHITRVARSSAAGAALSTKAPMWAHNLTIHGRRVFQRQPDGAGWKIEGANAATNNSPQVAVGSIGEVGSGCGHVRSALRCGSRRLAQPRPRSASSGQTRIVVWRGFRNEIDNPRRFVRPDQVEPAPRFRQCSAVRKRCPFPIVSWAMVVPFDGAPACRFCAN